MINQELKIGAIADQIRGVSYKKDVVRKEPFGGYIPILKANNIRGDFKIDTNDLIYIPKEFVKENQILKAGDIIIAASSGSKKIVGKAAGFNLPQEYSFGAFCKVIRPKSTKIRVKFLWYYFQSYRYRALISELAAGANILNIRNSHLNDIVISAPEDLKEQDNITNALDRAQAIIDKRQKSIELVSELLRDTFFDMFGDLSAPDNEWPKRTLIDLCTNKNDIRCGPFGTQLKKEEFLEEGIPLWGIKHVNSEFSILTNEFVSAEKAEYLKNYTLKPRDIVMTRKGTVGNSHVYPPNLEKGIMHSDVLRVRINEELINPYFLSYQFKHNRELQWQINRVSAGVVMAGINVSRLKKVEVRLPPKKKQDEFEIFLENLTKLKFKLEENPVNLLFQSILQRALHGDLTLDMDLQLDSFIGNKDFEAIEKDDVLIQLLIDRFENHNLGKVDVENPNEESENGYHFESLKIYEKAKSVLFYLLKKEKAVQQYDTENNKINLSLP